MARNSIGILLQGAVTDWSEKMVKAYQENFPTAEILYSTCEKRSKSMERSFRKIFLR